MRSEIDIILNIGTLRWIFYVQSVCVQSTILLWQICPSVCLSHVGKTVS